jgi:PhnB protein
MMQSNPYLYFNGECEAAFKFYEQCLGGKIVEIMTYADAPADMPIPEQSSTEWRNQIMHVTLKIDSVVLMGSDAPPDYFEKPQGFYVNLQFDTVAEAEQVFNALAENGTVQMPFQKTFWAERFAMLSDRFGTPWMINCAPVV